MSSVHSLYPIQGTEYMLTPGESKTIVLADENVPKEAYEVIVYARVQTGHCDCATGELILSSMIPNGLIERKVYCSLYNQQAWSYNSENISLPVAPVGSKIITAKLNGPSAVKNAQGYVQVVGYRM